MDEFSNYSSEVVEFPSTWERDKTKRFVHTSSLTDPLQKPENKDVQTNEKFNVMVQTDRTCDQMISTDEKKLAAWLKKIYDLVDAELSKGITPLHDSVSGYTGHDITIKLYQKLTDDVNCTQGAAVWLSLRSNDASLLVLATSASHSDWCDHVGKSIKIFSPKRMPSQNFVVFSELTTLVVKSCVKSLSTNRFNKDIFAGGTYSGDLYIWQYKTQVNVEEVKEIHNESTENSCIIAMDWLTEHELLTCHTDGYIFLWQIRKEVIKDKCFKVIGKSNKSLAVITAILAISNTDFIVGTEEGQLLVCSTTNQHKGYEDFINPVLSELEGHSFAVSTLARTKFAATDVAVSCDLSGEVFFYDIRNSEDGPTLIVKMPLPFKNCIGLSEGANYIFSPGTDGSLETFRISNGKHFIVDGNLQGKGSIIKVSDNGFSKKYTPIALFLTWEEPDIYRGIAKAAEWCKERPYDHSDIIRNAGCVDYTEDTDHQVPVLSFRNGFNTKFPTISEWEENELVMAGNRGLQRNIPNFQNR